jgi:hypothetical protein
MEQERQMLPNVGPTFSDMSLTYRPTHQCRIKIANADIRQTQLSLQEASNLTTSKPCPPASTFHEVQCNIGTFCAFLYILFGSKCKYYAKLMDLKIIFNDPSTQSIYEAFTVPVCRHIVWAIVCDGRFFFSKVKLSQDLMPGTGWKDPPSSLLSLIMDKVMFAEQIT